MALREQFTFVFRFLKYWFQAVDEHTLHAPFVFRYHRDVIREARSLSPNAEIELLREAFLKDQRLISVNDLGAGSNYTGRQSRKVSHIAKTALSQRKLTQLIALTIRHFECREVVELGTSLGINTQYMARAFEGAQVHTFEGVEEIYEIAVEHLSNLPNVTCHLGDIDAQLPLYLEHTNRIDLAYIDANHTFEATLRYFELLLPKVVDSSVMIIGDIHWSDGMEQAWSQISARPEVAISLDLFHCGLLFFMPYNEKQDYALRF